MNGFRMPLFLTMLCLTGMAAIADDKPTVRLEFRRAEEKPMEGLTEAMAPNGKDKIYLHKAADLTNEDVASVKVGESRSGSPELRLTFTKEGAENEKALNGAPGQTTCHPRRWKSDHRAHTPGSAF